MRALITGITGQAGSELAQQLLCGGNEVIGLVRRTSGPSTGRLAGYLDHRNLTLVEGDVTDPMSLVRALRCEPDVVFHLAAMSHVHVSFGEPSHTWAVTAQGTLNLLEAIRGMERRPRVLHASSSEMFGSRSSLVEGRRCQDEDTPMVPNSPYAIAKLAAHHAVRLYRSHGLWAANAIFFNMEGPGRGHEFVTRKITRYVARWQVARERGEVVEPLRLGNLEASRDWTCVSDSMRAARLMVDLAEPVDLVVASGETHTVREFLERAFAHVGQEGELPVVVDERFMRPCEVPFLCGRSARLYQMTGWEPVVTFEGLVAVMVDADLEEARGRVSHRIGHS